MLTFEATRCPRNRGQPYLRNLLLAFNANTESAVGDSGKSSPDLTQATGLAVQAAAREFSFDSLLAFVSSVSGGVHFDGVALAVYNHQLPQLRFQTLFNG